MGASPALFRQSLAEIHGVRFSIEKTDAGFEIKGSEGANFTAFLRKKDDVQKSL